MILFSFHSSIVRPRTVRSTSLFPCDGIPDFPKDNSSSWKSGPGRASINFSCLFHIKVLHPISENEDDFLYVVEYLLPSQPQYLLHRWLIKFGIRAVNTSGSCSVESEINRIFVNIAKHFKTILLIRASVYNIAAWLRLHRPYRDHQLWEILLPNQHRKNAGHRVVSCHVPIIPCRFTCGLSGVTPSSLIPSATRRLAGLNPSHPQHLVGHAIQ